jgi:hypothetical protein
MGKYDSDSSDGEDNDFTETNVLLGYASGDANGEEISRLGGYPVRPLLSRKHHPLYSNQIFMV